MRIGPTLAVASVIVAGAVVARADDAVVHPGQQAQRISGFGASSAWTAQNLSDADANLLFSPDEGVGLSLLRVRVAPDGTCLEVATALKAQARGASVWAAPWSPPAAWKANKDVNNGGALLAEHADDWAATLVRFLNTMKTSGVEIVGLSAQNEPSTPPPGRPLGYESCHYSPASLADFIGNHLGPAVAASGSTVPIVGPETQGWIGFPAYASAILAHPAAAGFVRVVATHAYDGSPSEHPSIAQAGKELWQTEAYDNRPGGANDPGMGQGLWVAVQIHAALVFANVAAWHFWWIRPNAPDNGALWDRDSGLPTKRLYVMGNYSKFVRPGFYRVAATSAPRSGLQLTAFHDDPSQRLVIVAINQGSAAVTQRFLFDGVTTGRWTSWVTSEQSNHAPGAPIPNGDGLSYTFDPQSVTTLAGVVTGPGPVVSDIPPNQDSASAKAGCACSHAAASMRSSEDGRAWMVAIFTLASMRSRWKKGHEALPRRRARVGPERPGPILA